MTTCERAHAMIRAGMIPRDAVYLGTTYNDIGALLYQCPDCCETITYEMPDIGVLDVFDITTGCVPISP